MPFIKIYHPEKKEPEKEEKITPWANVIAKEYYKSLSIEEKNEVREDYFDKVISPRARKKQYSLSAVKREFFQYTNELEPKIFSKPEEFELKPPGIGQAIKSGLSQSIPGMMLTEQEPYTPTSRAQRIAQQAGMLVGDMPIMAAGAALAGIPGAFGLPAGTKAVLQGQEEKGKLSKKEFDIEMLKLLSGEGRIFDPAKEAVKGLLTGAVTRGAGKGVPALTGRFGRVGKSLAPFTKIPAEIGGMVTAGAGLEGRAPTSEEFMDAAILLGGIKVANKIAPVIRQTFKRTGKPPEDVIKEITKDIPVEEFKKLSPELMQEAIRRIGFEAPKYDILETMTKTKSIWNKSLLPEGVKKIQTEAERLAKNQEKLELSEAMKKTGLNYKQIEKDITLTGKKAGLKPEEIKKQIDEAWAKTIGEPQPDFIFSKFANVFSKKLGKENTKNVLNNLKIQDITKIIDPKIKKQIVTEMADAVYRKKHFGRYGSITKIVNKTKIIDGIQTTPIYECYANLLKKIPVLKERQGMITPSNRMMDKLGESFKKLLYWDAKDAELNIVREKRTTMNSIHKIRKALPRRASKRIDTYAAEQQRGGKEILTAMKKKPVELTPEEMIAYKTLRANYEQLYTRLKEARIKSGKEMYYTNKEGKRVPIFGKVENYSPFFRQLEEMTEKGFNPVTANAEVIAKFIKPIATGFVHAKKRKGGKQPIKLDAFGNFEKYLTSALDHIHLSPIISKTNKLTNTLYPKGKRYLLKEENPYASEFLNNWAADLASKKQQIYIGGAPFTKLDNIASKINRNLVYSILSFNTRTALIQSGALRNTVVEAGLANTIEGIKRNTLPKWREFANKYSNLDARKFDTNIEEAITSWSGLQRKVGTAGLKPLQLLDMETARASWLTFYKDAKDRNMSFERARRYANDAVVRTQASAARSDRPPIQRTPLGKTASLFQTFIIHDWQFLTKDVLGIGNPKITNKKAMKKVISYIATTTAFNILYEDIIGINSPFPTPINTYKESRESGDTKAQTFWKIAKEGMEPIPFLSSARYGSSLGGAAISTAEELYKGKTTPSLETVAKLSGIPGASPAAKAIRIKKLGGSDLDVLLGRYPKKK